MIDAFSTCPGCGDDWFAWWDDAARLKLHERTVRRMCGRGEIPAVRVARRWRINEADLPTAAPARPLPPPRPRAAGGRLSQVAREVTGAMTPTEP